MDTPPYSDPDVLDPAVAEAIERYVVGGEAALQDPQVARVVAAHPELVRQLREAMVAMRTKPSGATEQSLAHALERLVTAPRSTASPSVPIRRWNVRIIGISALGLMLCAAAGLYGILRPKSTRPISTRTYATTTGQRAVVELNDGTRVTLAPRSELRVSTAFGTHDRIVALEGEAYFDVTTATHTPFIVHAGGVRTRVLGTKFFVRHYAADSQVRVAVMSGKVSVSARVPKYPDVAVAAGWTAHAGDSSVATVPAGDTSQYNSWLNDYLVFYRAPAVDVLSALTRWYGYQFRFDDPSLSRRKLTAVVSARSSAAALSTLKLLLDVDLSFDGTLVTLTQRRVPPVPAAPSRRDGAKVLTSESHEVGR